MPSTFGDLLLRIFKHPPGRFLRASSETPTNTRCCFLLGPFPLQSENEYIPAPRLTLPGFKILAPPELDPAHHLGHLLKPASPRFFCPEGSEDKPMASCVHPSQNKNQSSGN